MNGRGVAGVLLCALSLVLSSGCPGENGGGVNPASVWLGYGQREVDLVLLDHEPPPF